MPQETLVHCTTAQVFIHVHVHCTSVLAFLCTCMYIVAKVVPPIKDSHFVLVGLSWCSNIKMK